MALDGVIHHRKTRRLARLLNLPDECLAMGPLESLWFVTRKHAPSGDFSHMSNQDIADEMRWSGDANQLVGALVEAGWMDRIGSRLVVHDWHQHADDTTHAKLFRRVEFFYNGVMPRPGSKCGPKDQARILAKYEVKFGKPVATLFQQEHVVAAEQQAKTVHKEENTPNLVSITRVPPGPCQRPEPVPVPEPEEPPTPLHARGSVEEPVLSKREVRRALELQRRSAAGWAVHAASQEMLDALNMSGRSSERVQLAMVEAINGECRRVHKPPETHAATVAEAMLFKYALWARDGPLMRYQVGPVKFFEQGYWSDNGPPWPYDQQRLDAQAQARVGTYR